MKTKNTDNGRAIAAVFAKKYGTLVALFAICVFFTIRCPGVFLTKSNIITVLRQISILAVMGAGMTVIMIGGGIDLSCGYNVSFCGIIAATLYQQYGLPLWLAAIGALAFGSLIGLFNGLLVAYVRIPAFICTMSAGFLIQGLNQAYTKGYPISGLNNAFDTYALKTTFGIPNAIYIMA
ncbi:MAG: ABC transporter permease, partial [Clostridiales bacterium]|nr:ABC transporter permease [Clostridiales bacterium]